MTLWNTQQEDLDAIARSTQWADEPEAPEPYPEPATVEGEEPESASETVPAADAPVEPTANRKVGGTNPKGQTNPKCLNARLTETCAETCFVPH